MLLSMLLSACSSDENGKVIPGGVAPTFDLSSPLIYKTDSAGVIRYFDPLQCPSTGKVTVTIQPDYRAKMEVVSPDVESAYVNKVGGDLKCNETGDLHVDTFYGLYDPAARQIIFKICDKDMLSRDDIAYITLSGASTQAFCGYTVDGKYQLWMSVDFANAPLSK